MSYQVTVLPSGHQFQVNEYQSVLDAALEAGIIIPYSCKGGNCCSCKGKIVEGKTTDVPLENLLETTEIQAGYTLLCQAKPLSDLKIEVNEVRLAGDVRIRKLPVRVMGLDRLSDDVMKVTLQLPANEDFHYYPGQYIEFILKGNVRRAYSIANISNEQKQLELHIRHLPSGMFTDHVFGAGQTAMKVREILRIEGPLGTFYLRQDSDKPIIMLATGTGFAPIKALVETSINASLQRPIHIYWGGRYQKDLYMQSLIEQWVQTYPHIKFTPVLSREKPAENWHGKTGYVQDAVLSDIPNLTGYEVYACGSPAMIESARHAFLKSGLNADDFYADAFIIQKT
ncbi:CDP-6-deoxy-delta-3,4-glucoseen reductase [Basilea psittacipulmonis]|uniref:CDP-6-deoxy-delta-3,4-glucoseen reductase n=1 Tax=Basilea psittacipulmonis DSM 24701 TaxID=1072685 RepID=A0A077DGI4_9BURK|nr:CDP-6-deoxy-delta-3,4-glucoseen reductase [Basilea psittacipulmonis]AIL32597.1 CDP-6-deoxy-delta-3,4-glucoseen reductase [Basilea psittacipulmonis DSM 24701]